MKKLSLILLSFALVPSMTACGGSRLTENFVGAAFPDYDSYLILPHFKGHTMASFGGAIKNISIGIGSSEGKAWIHSGGTSKTSIWGGEQDPFLESMAEAGSSVVDALDGSMVEPVDFSFYAPICSAMTLTNALTAFEGFFAYTIP